MDGRSANEMALDMPGTAKKEHFGRPSYSVKKKTYLKLSEEEGLAVVKLTRDQQAAFGAEYPDAFAPVNTNLGKHGWTSVSLDHVGERTFRYVVDLAWRNVAPKWLIATRQAPPKA